MASGRGWTGNVVLGVGHVAGMIDMVALPLWVGALIAHYGFSPAQAGGVVTAFLISVVAASAVIAPRFERLPHRLCVALGFAAAAICFFIVSRLPVGVAGFPALAGLHVLAGLGVGVGLSITHGAIGRTVNPHRLFGVVNVALGVLGVLTFATLPGLIEGVGAQVMFLGFAAVMAAASLICAVGFPETARMAPAAYDGRARVPRAAWFVIGVVICMTFNQAMVFSFVSQVGLAHGFGQSSVNGVLIALGLVNLFPGALAAMLQSRFSPVAVGFAGPVAQAALALTLTYATTFAPFAVAGAVFVSVVIFTHTFLFGLLSRIDTSGRSVAATPAMMMIGSCTGPLMGGLIVSSFGYPGLGWAATLAAAVAVSLLALLRLQLQAAPANLAPAHG